MNKRYIGLLYALTLFFAVVFFIFYLFPGQKIEKHMTIMFGRALPDYNLTIATPRPAFPLAIKIPGAKVMQADKVVFETDFVKIGIPPKSFFSPATSFYIKSRVYDGKANGTVNVVENPKRVTADISLSGIRVEKIPAVAQMTQAGMSGVLNGTLTVDSAAASGQAVAKLHIDDASVPLSESFMNLTHISFKAIEVEASLSGPDFVVTQCTFKGNQLDGQMAGKMNLKDPFEESTLDLSGTIQPHPELLKNFPIQMLPMRQNNKKGLGFRITGTFGTPGFSLR
jgi:type II secretion system protein N